MKRLGLYLSLLLGLVLAGLSANLLRKLPASSALEWRTPPLLRVSPKDRDALANLERDYRLTYWVTEASELPSHLRDLGEQTTRILREIERLSEGRVAVEIRHPELHEEATSLLAARGLRPFRSQQLVQDRFIETSLWSSLWMTSGAREGIALQPLLPDKLPELSAWVSGELLRLESGEEPAPVSIAVVSSTPRPALLSVLSAAGAKAQSVTSTEAAAGDFDAVWLFDSTEVARDSETCQRFLQSGRDVVLALPEDEVSPATAALWVSFGAEIEPGELRVDGSNQLRAIAPHQDFRSFPLQPNGTLNFGRAHPLRFSTARLKRLGRSLQPLAWTAPESSLWRSDSDERPAPRRPLLSLLSPPSSREGRLVLVSSDRVFSTAVMQAEDPTHRNLVRALLASEPSKLAFSRIRSAREDTLPTLSGRQRSIARSICIGAGPVLLFGLALMTRRRRSDAQLRALSNQARLAPAAFALALLAPGLLALLLDRGAPRSWRADATRDGSHQLSPAEREFLVGSLKQLGSESGPLQLELVSTSDAQLPASIRARKRDLLELLADWPLDATRPGGEASWIVTDPERDWDDEERAAARQLGLTPRDLALANVDGRTASLRVPELWCGLILRSGERQSSVSLLEEGGSLRFRLAFALWRLSADEEIDIAFAVDRGLLSSAEALLDYSERGLFAPTEGDATGAARSALRAAGFTLRELDTQARAAELSKQCAEADALCWIQPRREIGPMLQAMTETLARGGAALLCAQHHEIEARQLGRDGLNIEFWPRPLKTDLERAYLPQLGIQLVQELYFDASAAALPLPMRVEAGAENGQVRDLQLGVQPFMVRATAPGLGELALPSASRILFDAERGRSYGLKMKPLVLGSPSWWSYDWSGGNLPRELLQRSEAAVEEAPRTPQILSALFEGRFPRAEEIEAPGPASLEPGADGGRLLLTGNSLFLRDSLLATSAGKIGSEFLVDGLARLTLPAALADLNRRRTVPPPLEPLPSSTRTLARILVLGLGPSLLALLFGLRSFRAR